jgi:phage RecT family recombinase
MTATIAVKKSDELKTSLAQYEERYTDLLPSGYPANRLIAAALVCASKNPELLQCKPITVALALAKIAQWGLDPGYTAHLVPFNVNVAKRDEPARWEKHCEAIADYKGLIQLMTLAGARKVEAREVREGDEFAYALGSEQYLRHTPKNSAGKILGAWAMVTLRYGVIQIDYMTADEIEAIRKKSKQWSKGELPYWYARKSVLRRMSKYVASSPRLAAALEDEPIPLGEAQDVTDADLTRFEPEARRGVKAIAQPTDPYDPETGEVLGGAEVGEQEQGDAFEGGL